MNANAVQRKVTVPNPQGLHMRPISAFVQLAGKYQSIITVYNPSQQRFDGKSVLSLMGLAAEQGTILTIEASGPDQEAALEALSQLIADLCRFEAELETR